MPPKAAPKKGGKPKKEKLFHPLSRKADQLVRAQHRKSKLQELAKERTKKQGVEADIYGFFYHAIPPEGVFSLEDIHTIVRDVWLTRYDSMLEEEKAQRRPGRPKSTKEQKIEELKLREAEEYRTGFQVIDLTEPANVALFKQWDQKAPSYIKQLRFIRISSSSPETYTVVKWGIHPSLPKPPKPAAAETSASSTSAHDVAMDEDEVPLLLDPSVRFSSTITGMDEIPA
ncbi:translation machinery-associated protein 16 domain-containing protein [Phanerochaete sordida]|uniref:Translation machinery-associated protein 16 domain-containing protein n=1 Tax=Phanerochaete sordida TaxID=48140 RepID=A0A9P3LDV6_9APHY|nr:translation machinery-associated protein 16 domain-containing protein [Phanerochaete sordida]